MRMLRVEHSSGMRLVPFAKRLDTRVVLTVRAVDSIRRAETPCGIEGTETVSLAGPYPAMEALNHDVERGCWYCAVDVNGSCVAAFDIEGNIYIDSHS